MKYKAYFISLGAILLLCAYPLWMGAKILAAHFRDGYIVAADYPKYVIPYTPIAVALIVCAALLPLIVRYGKRFALLAVSVLGVGLFLLAETGFERVVVFDTETVLETRKIPPENRGEMPEVLFWQYALCRGPTEEELQAIEEARQQWEEEVVEVERVTMEALAARYTPAFKIHFYLIAILIVLAVLSVVYGFYKMTRDKRKPLILQTAAVSVFMGLCIFACFTAFYRTGALLISPISALLMGLFFIAFGVTAGAYTGSLLYARKWALARLLPALVAIATAVAMYLGELILLGGTVYRFGEGFFFAPLGPCPLAPADFAVVALSGALTYGLLFLIRRKEPAID